MTEFHESILHLSALGPRKIRFLIPNLKGALQQFQPQSIQPSGISLFLFILRRGMVVRVEGLSSTMPQFGPLRV
jgi:hypothetical protein